VGWRRAEIHNSSAASTTHLTEQVKALLSPRHHHLTRLRRDLVQQLRGHARHFVVHLGVLLVLSIVLVLIVVSATRTAAGAATAAEFIARVHHP
jgi:hypothetical protein